MAPLICLHERMKVHVHYAKNAIHILADCVRDTDKSSIILKPLTKMVTSIDFVIAMAPVKSGIY